MSGELENALATAGLECDGGTVRAEMHAMESRIDAGLVQMRERRFRYRLPGLHGLMPVPSPAVP